MAMAGLGQWPDALYAATGEETVLTILHTNDMHSRIDPFPADDKRYGGQGGMSQRAALIKSFRQTAQHVVLLDSGDIFQGTPYFNYFGGEPEFRLMSAMGYDAATMGNHDFDAGVEDLQDSCRMLTSPFLYPTTILPIRPCREERKTIRLSNVAGSASESSVSA